MYTLGNFSSKIELCIEWGLVKFIGYFINDISNFIEDSTNFFKIIENKDNVFEKIQILKAIIKPKSILKENDYDKILEYSIEVFCNNFDFQIKKLI